MFIYRGTYRWMQGHGVVYWRLLVAAGRAQATVGRQAR